MPLFVLIFFLIIRSVVSNRVANNGEQDCHWLYVTYVATFLLHYVVKAQLIPF